MIEAELVSLLEPLAGEAVSVPGMVIAERAPEDARHGAERASQPRLGHGTFQVLVIEVYRRRRAVTGERIQ
jgi:hypothetical protein